MSPSRSLRILFVTHAFPPDSGAGVELYTLRLAKGLEERGHRPVVVTSRQRRGLPQYAVRRAEVDGIPVLGIVQNWPYRDLPEAVTDPAIDRVFDRLLEELRPDLVSVQTLTHLSAGMLEVAARLRVPVVVHLHDAWWTCPTGGQRWRRGGGNCLPVDRRLCGECFDRHRHTEGPLERAARWLAGRTPGLLPPDGLHRTFEALPRGARELLRGVNQRLAPVADGRAPSRRGGIDPRIADRHRAIGQALTSVHRVLSPSRFLLESLADDGLELPSARVLSTGVPTGGPVLPVDADERGPLRILFLGTWVPHKGPQVLARALAWVEGPVEATAVGPTPFPAFRDEVKQLSQGRLACRGPVGADEVAGLMDRAEVVVVPSTWAENAPLVALEARARGRPVVASDLGGLPELVEEGVDGRLFPAGDAEALATILGGAEELRTLAKGVRPPKTLETFVGEVEDEYLELAR